MYQQSVKRDRMEPKNVFNHMYFTKIQHWMMSNREKRPKKRCSLFTVEVLLYVDLNETVSEIGKHTIFCIR